MDEDLVRDIKLLLNVINKLENGRPLNEKDNHDVWRIRLEIFFREDLKN